MDDELEELVVGVVVDDDDVVIEGVGVLVVVDEGDEVDDELVEEVDEDVV